MQVVNLISLLNAEGCQAPLRVTNWSDGSGVTLLNDIDSATDGLQVSISVSGNADEIVNFELNVNGEPGDIVGPLTLDALGLGELAITLPTELATLHWLQLLQYQSNAEDNLLL